MSFWLKVRSAIRAGEEMLPEASGHVDPPVVGYDPPGASPIPPKPVREEPVVVPVPEPIVVPEPEDPQDTPQQAEVDAQRYIAQVKPLGVLIGKTEGTARGRGYDETLGYGAYDPQGFAPITKQSLATLDRFQTAMLAHPKNKLNSSAVGLYQYIRTTLRALRKKWSLADDLMFDAILQDDLFYITLIGRGLARWRKGELTDNAFIDALSAEWASLPNSKGKGTYKGQHTGCSLEELRAVLAQIK